MKSLDTVLQNAQALSSRLSQEQQTSSIRPGLTEPRTPGVLASLRVEKINADLKYESLNLDRLRGIVKFVYHAARGRGCLSPLTDRFDEIAQASKICSSEVSLALETEATFGPNSWVTTEGNSPRHLW
jgi:hypothetical protein